jgi:ribosomal protein S3
MGHVINPISLRISINRLWKSEFFVEDTYNFNYLNLQEMNIKHVLKKIFQLRVFPRNGLLFSHFKIIYFSNYINVKVYLYKTKSNIDLIFGSFNSLLLLLTKVFYKKILIIIILKLTNLFKFYFFSLNYFFNQIFILMKSKFHFFNIRDLVLIYLFLLLKRSRIQLFYSLLNTLFICRFSLKRPINNFNFIFYFSKNKISKLHKRFKLLYKLKRKIQKRIISILEFKAKFKTKKKRLNLKLINKIYDNLEINKFKILNLLILKLFIWFVRIQFWQKVSFFILFFLKRFVYNKMIIHICKVNFIGVQINTIGSYIILRLEQRFKVMQIMSSIVQTLKENNLILGFKFSFCGRFSRNEMATYDYFSNGSVPLNTLQNLIEYKLFGVILKDSFCGIKVWINRKKDKLYDLSFYSNNMLWKYTLI